MNARSKKIGLAAATLALGFATITLFQNCSAGSLPPGLEDSASVASTTPSIPLSGTATPNSIVASAQTMITVSGGQPPYSLVPSGGGLQKLQEGLYTYTAPATPGTYTVTITDSRGQSAPAVYINVAAKDPDPAPAPTTSPSKQLYSYYNGSTGYHAYTDQDPWTATGFLKEGPAYKLAADGNTGAVPYYQCKVTVTATGFDWFGMSTSYDFYFDSVDAACEGQPGATSVQTGYIYRDNTHPGTVGLYRYVNDKSVDHITSTNSSLEAQLGEGWRNEGVRGWVPSN